jgi:hypothetical protein
MTVGAVFTAGAVWVAFGSHPVAASDDDVDH